MILGCKNIQKAYGTDVILNDITFGLEDNEKAAIIGVNGAGKTTLFKIIAEGLSYDNGDLFLKKNITIGYMAQNARLESEKTVYEEMDSVFDSVREMESELRKMEEEMSLLSGNELKVHMDNYDALRHKYEQTDAYSYKSRINGVLKGLGFTPDQYDMPLTTLSGGQRQRVAIARAMLRNAPIVILDEATSALDNESEAIVQKAMDNLMQDRTVFIIAHRLSTIKNANRIAVINSGELVELGTHDELMNIPDGQYKALYDMQFKKQEQ